MADSIGSDFHSPQPDAAAPAGVPDRVGATLRAAREAQGLSLKDIAARTRITARHVEALEAGDYDSLPGRPYALGFARSYAKAVGLDEAAIAQAVRTELSARAPAPETRVIHQFEAGDPAKTPSRLVSWLAGLLVVAVLGLGLVFWRSYYWPSAELPALVGPEEPKPVAAKPAAQPSAPAPAARPNGPVVFTAQEDRIWVKFYDGSGKQLVQKLMAKGETYTVPDGVTDPKLWTGRPDALTITIGGQAVPRIADKQGIVKDVAVSGPALWARADRAAAAAPAPDGQAVAAGADAGPAHRLVRRRTATTAPVSADAGGDAAAQPAVANAAPETAAPATN
ncbi:MULTISPECIES: helix-turn-helix domain-containing protein [unclassified Novosphingobium]|uniref:helix-turn-helix domain-containing protein n=1 Tax=unclassified Novosphingobium TaxID=2644732 RepID=UPI00146CE1FA|nr:MULTISPECIES: helix-turn-helix domain-containing protein [unclassified Novosphingobium]NMN05799.1 transcriptional regulator with XRE-family HTH domain [Novosphingobium sp. SG919]NMN87841.1 transcriptional regulator with XRE-family HTH domain [Novosphingobium sp. SG916]